MLHEISVVFPHQLFEHNPCLDRKRPVYLIEDALYFRQFKFHKKKLMFHRASMKYYEAFLAKKKYDVTYVDAFSEEAELDRFFTLLHNNSIKVVHYVNTVDYLLERRLTRYAKRNNIQLRAYESPQFLNSSQLVREYFSGRKDYFLHDFYIRERKRLNILVDGKKPVGGKWSFDAENRKPIPKSLVIPGYKVPRGSKFTNEAQEYVKKYFDHNYGDDHDFNFAVTHEGAKECFETFLNERFTLFGPYEDAIISNQSYLFHSVMTPYLNSGLITPEEAVRQMLEFAQKEKTPLASFEGYMRQIIGWREFMRGVYEYNGVFQRKRNFWNHQRKMPNGFYHGETGILPVDTVVKRLLDRTYTHHIERLMVLGNIMLLCEIRPDDIYQWFMELYIDAYDWVMVPNVYGMSQFADGGLMSTKPYFSGSNYIIKMSDFRKGEWSTIWNSLYWRFVYKHKEYFQSNQRTTMMAMTLSKMDKKTLQGHIKLADQFLKKLDTQQYHTV
jgi:deoxyribodipyrimidine photolyase-related protein